MALRDEAKALLGKQVKVILDKDEWLQIPNDEWDDDLPAAEASLNPNPNPVIVKGKLLSFSGMGAFVIEDDMGDVHYCWPLLEITADE